MTVASFVSMLAGRITGAAAAAGIAPVDPLIRRSTLDLDGYADTLVEVAATAEPHRLCGYLYRLARTFTAFYERCPVLRAAPEVRAGRLVLCRLTGDTLRDGLGLLGIEAPDTL